MSTKSLNRIFKRISFSILVGLSSYSAINYLTNSHKDLFNKNKIQQFIPRWLHSLRTVSLWRGVECLQTKRANKPQIVKLINQTKQQLIILIYNRQSENSLRQKIIKLEQLAEKNNINQVILVDQTDIRHLETFTRILRENVDDQNDRKQRTSKEPVDLQGKIKIMYVNPMFDTNKPFLISQQLLTPTIAQIRSILTINPKQQQVQKSINKPNSTTIVKNCYNSVCIQEYKQKVRELIQLQLFRDKQENYSFYVTNSKQQAQKISNLIGQTSNKQEIYVFRNDILGKSRDLYSEFLDKQGSNYGRQNKFMMMIRPRVHILSRKSLSTDLFWYISCLKNNSVPTFSINNTSNNFPIRFIDQESQNRQKQNPNAKATNNIIFTKGHVKEIELIRRIKQRYGNKIEVLIVETTLPSQLIRHVYQPQRYCIFKLSPQVPYPKMLIKPPVIDMNMKVWNKMRKIQFNGQNSNQNRTQNNNSNKGQNKDNYSGIFESDNLQYNQKWSRIIQKIDRFIEKPANYSPVRLYSQKQLEINARELQQLLQQAKRINQNSSKATSQTLASSKLQDKNKFIFRICGFKNPCLYSVYQRYGIDINTKVYKLDGNVQNIGIDQGDYCVQGESIKLLE